MALRLQVRQRDEAGGPEKPKELLLDEPIITLGRDKSCQVVLSQSAVSRNHARITQDGSLFFLEDLGSAYGTQVNGDKLPPGEKRLIRDGDVIAIAQFDVTFERVAPAKSAARSENTAFAGRQAIKDVMRGVGAKAEDKPYFRFMNGPRDGERVEIADAQELTLGRDEDVEIFLDDDLVSRHHAKIRRDWSGTHVEDLGSRNGIRVNRKRVTRRTLKDQDELEVGDARLLYINPNEPAQVVAHPAVREEVEDTDHQEVSAPKIPTPPPEQAPANGDAGGPPFPEVDAPPGDPDAALAPADEADAAPGSPSRLPGPLRAALGGARRLFGDRKRALIIAAMGLGALIAFVILLLILIGV